MKLSVVTVLVVAVVGASAFQSSSIPSSSVSSTSLFGYVPDGFTPESYKKFKEAEAKKKARNLGALGPKGFQSRSMQSFQEAMERGEATHLMPMFNAQEKLKSGKIRKEDIPVSFNFNDFRFGGSFQDFVAFSFIFPLLLDVIFSHLFPI